MFGLYGSWRAAACVYVLPVFTTYYRVCSSSSSLGAALVQPAVKRPINTCKAAQSANDFSAHCSWSNSIQLHEHLSSICVNRKGKRKNKPKYKFPFRLFDPLSVWNRQRGTLASMLKKTRRKNIRCCASSVRFLLAFGASILEKRKGGDGLITSTASVSYLNFQVSFTMRSGPWHGGR